MKHGRPLPGIVGHRAENIYPQLCAVDRIPNVKHLLQDKKACLLTIKKKRKKRENDPGFRNQVHEETSQYSLLEARDQRLGGLATTGKINFLVGPQEPLLETVKRRKLEWFGHVTRHDSLSKTILQCALEGGRRCGRPRKCWMDNEKEWTCLPMPEMLTRPSCRKHWKRISAESSVMSPRGPNRPRD